MKDPKPFQPVCVEWFDAHTEASESYDSPAAALEAHKPAIRRSIGFWVGRSSSVVAFATDDDRDACGNTSISGISYIPIALVRQITPLRAKPLPINTVTINTVTKAKR